MYEAYSAIRSYGLRPSGLIRALTSNGGPRNTLVVMFQLDRENIVKMIQRNRQGFDTLDKVGRYNAIRYTNESITLIDYSDNDPCKVDVVLMAEMKITYKTTKKQVRVNQNPAIAIKSLKWSLTRRKVKWI